MQSTQQVPGAQSDAPVHSFFKSAGRDVFAVCRDVGPLAAIEQASSILSVVLDLAYGAESSVSTEMSAIIYLAEVAKGLVDHAVAVAPADEEDDDAAAGRELVTFLLGALDVARLSAEQARTQKMRSFQLGKAEGLAFAIEAAGGKR